MRGFLAASILLLMFLLASAPARNSDLWLHLGLGKALAEGRYVLGSEPFLQHPPEYWANPSWLTDYVAYLVYAWFGGFGLVIAKAAAMTCLAWLLASLARFREFLWVATFTTLLAVVALGAYLTLRPFLLSFLFLGALLVLLERQRDATMKGAVSPLSYWPIWCLQALWANCDGWFLLGPVVVAIYVLAQNAGSTDTNRIKSALIGLGGTLLATLVNPHHILVWQLPSAFSFSFVGQKLRSMFLQAFYPAGFAYVVLVLASLLSFVVNRRRTRGVDILVWLFFFGLTMLQTLAAPFFAIAAAPILARNLEGRWEASASPANKKQERTRNSLFAYGRFLVMAACVLLPILAWPGWLQGVQEPRRWKVIVDPSLQKAAETIAQWRQEEKLPAEALEFNLTDDAVHYFPYFAPGEKVFFDTRLKLLGDRTRREGTRVADGFLNPKLLDAKQMEKWREELRGLKIGYVVVHAPQVGRMAPALSRLFQSKEEWPLLFMEGSTLIFGWRDPTIKPPDPKLALLEQSPLRWAVQPPPERAAPLHWSGIDPAPFTWTAPFTREAGAGIPFMQEADLHLFHYDMMRPVTKARYDSNWLLAAAAKFILTPANAGNGLTFAISLPLADAFSMDQTGKQLRSFQAWLPGQRSGMAFKSSLEEAPPEYLFLAIRAARRGIEADPQEFRNYLKLGDAYMRLAGVAQEQHALKLHTFGDFRRLQAAVAFQQALTLNPQSEHAHINLVEIYQALKFWDLALVHAQEFRDLNMKLGPNPGETAGEFETRRRNMDKTINKLAGEVDRFRRRWESKAADLSVGKKAYAAFELGLPRLALEVLGSGEVASEREAQLLFLKLLQITGQAAEARTIVKGLPASEDTWRIKAVDAILTGDYESAIQALSTANLPHAGAFTQAVLLQAERLPVAITYAQLLALGSLTERALQDAEAQTLAALLALEAGHPRALEQLIRARERWNAIRSDFSGVDFPARAYLDGWIAKFSAK